MTAPKKKALVDVGKEAAREAQRKVLLAELKAQSWNLTATGEALSVGSPANVLRAIRTLGLDDHYQKAKDAGKISPGSRRAKE